MGMFDTFAGNCPRCGARFESQTKLGECVLAVIEVGARFHTDYESIELKDVCVCGAAVVAVFKDCRLVGFRDGGAQMREGHWGSIHPATGDREEQLAGDNAQFLETVEEIRKSRETKDEEPQ